jgi:Homocysteine S-methyltransferase
VRRVRRALGRPGGRRLRTRRFTDLPLGLYPNLGYLSAGGWRSETAIGGAEYADLALGWRAEGAQIVGGCCGVGSEHVAAAREVLEDPKAGNKREVELPSDVGESVEFATPVAEPWTDAHGRAPDDPFEQVSTHRPLDYWGRNLIDHLISLPPDALADDGVAYIP